MKSFLECWLEVTNPTDEGREEAGDILQKMMDSVGGSGQKSFLDAWLEATLGEKKNVH